MQQTHQPTARVLAIETSSSGGGIALAASGQILAARELPLDRRHTSDLMPAIRDLVAGVGWAPRDLTAVYFSAGPGSFTGLRLAATTARMLQWSVGCCVVACPTLEVIARNALSSIGPGVHVAALLDAKREQVFAACFRIETGAEPPELTECEPAALRDPASWLSTLPRPLCLVGEGIAKHRAAAESSGAALLPDDAWRPSAVQVVAVGERLARLGQFCEPHQVLPTYIRPPEAEEVYEVRRAAARHRRGE